MNTHRYGFTLTVLLLSSLLLAACGRQEPAEDQTAAWLDQGSRLLKEAAIDALGPTDWQRTWDFDRSETRFDEERFPDWAREEYQACVYWEAPLYIKTFNNDRRPGNSAVMIDIPYTAWGWILIGEGGVHFLEHAYKRDEAEEATYWIQAWEMPAAP